MLFRSMTLKLAGATDRKPQTGFDPAGQASAIAGIVALSFALMEGEAYGWHSRVILAAFGLALLSALSFLLIEAKGRSPLFPLRLLRNATVPAGMIAGLAVNIGLSGILFVLPLYFQQQRGMPAHTAGLAFLPMTIPLAFNPVITGRIVGRIGARLPMTAGFGLAAAGSLLLAQTGNGSSYALVMAGLLLIGFGVSLTIPSMMAAVISSVPVEMTGAASGALNSSRQFGATLGVAVLGSILNASASFAFGMRLSLTVVAVILLGGSLLSFAFIGRRRP